MHIVLWDTRKLDVSKDFAGGYGVGQYHGRGGPLGQFVRYMYKRDYRPPALASSSTIGGRERSPTMNPIEAVAIVLAGLAAGAINTIVGSGSLITFPTLLAFGYPPVVANVSNTLGLVPGSFSGVVGYRRELVGHAGQRHLAGVAVCEVGC